MRTEGWRKRLSAYVNGVRTQGYEHGTLDSWLFVCDAALAMTGTDHAAKHRGRYKSAAGGLKIIKKAKAANLADFAGQHFTERASPVLAQIGDLMAIPVDGPFGYALGILNGERVLVVTPNGIDSRDRSEATRSFEV